jgi:hypothetical protein
MRKAYGQALKSEGKSVKRIIILIGCTAGLFILGFMGWSVWSFAPLRSPVMKNVVHVYMDFLSVNENGQPDGERTKVEITDSDDKAFFISFFSNRFWLGDEYGCRCPTNDVIFIIETNNDIHTFGLGIGLRNGDPNLRYYNEDTLCDFSDEQLHEILLFLSRFEGTTNFKHNEGFQFILDYLQPTGDTP